MCIRLSLKIEPPATSTPRTTASREDLTGEKLLRPTHTDATQASCHTSLLSCYPNQMQPWCDNISSDVWILFMLHRAGFTLATVKFHWFRFSLPKAEDLQCHTFLLMISVFAVFVTQVQTHLRHRYVVVVVMLLKVPCLKSRRRHLHPGTSLPTDTGSATASATSAFDSYPPFICIHHPLLCVWVYSVYFSTFSHSLCL